MDRITSIEDLHRLAKRRVPKMFYDYMASGSWTESTLQANRDDFAKITLRQRVAVDMANRSTRTSMAGQQVAMPVALAPTGLAGMQHADGEILGARAAAKFGIPYCMSSMSICSIEDVARHTDAPFWFQLYVLRDHDFARRLIGRAAAAGCPVLVLTLDLQIMGQRHQDIKNGLSTPPKLTLRNILDMAAHPRWCLKMLGTRRWDFGNIMGHVEGVDSMQSLSGWVAEQFDLQLDWEAVKRIRDWWPGKLVLKGVLDVEDARKAADVGADVLLVSNHGGRQLDGAPSAISMLDAIIKAVGPDTEIWLDSGVRSGQDVLKAVASGARGVMIGRAWLYGLAAGGEAGVTKALEIIHKELDVTMALTGNRDINQVDQTIFHQNPFLANS